MSRHTKIIHDEIRHPCDQCDFKAETKFKLTHHKRIIHDKNLFKCSYLGCKYEAKMMASLVKHEETKHLGKRYPCEYCDYKATQRGTLKTHRRSMHPEIDNLFRDEKSNSSFCNQNSLQSHENDNIEELWNNQEIDPLQITPEFYTSETDIDLSLEGETKLGEQELEEINHGNVNFLPVDIKREKPSL